MAEMVDDDDDTTEPLATRGEVVEAARAIHTHYKARFEAVTGEAKALRAEAKGLRGELAARIAALEQHLAEVEKYLAARIDALVETVTRPRIKTFEYDSVSGRP